MHYLWILAGLAVGCTADANIWRRQSFSPSGSAAAAPSGSAAPSGVPAPSGSVAPSAPPAPSAAPSAAIAWPISKSPSASATPSSTLTNDQQVGNSIWGALPQRSFQKWIDMPAGQAYTAAPWGECNTTTCDPTIKSTIPNTNQTRHYDFTVSRSTLSPDGVLRDVILLNGQFPGPLIQANWGDWIEVTVHNDISSPQEGTSLHWHGQLQYGTQSQDGTPGLTQCPIAPGQSYTYKFRADQYGTSMYHAHYSAQYTAGVVGPVQIYGPSQLDYDIDLGPVLLSDWNHMPYFSIVQNVMTQNMTTAPPRSDSGLINGRGRYNCDLPSYGTNATNSWYANTTLLLASDVPSAVTWTCVDGAALSKFQFTRGKVHRLRLINSGADGIHKFSIDGHTMTVIATDFVPTVPYTTDAVTLGVGQRTDVLVTAGGDSTAAYWMRSELLDAATCGGLAPPGTNNVPVLAGVYYEAADTTVDPTSYSTLGAPSCDNDDLSMTTPIYAFPPSTTPFYQSLFLDLAPNATGSYEWQINGQSYQADYNTPLLYEVAAGTYSFPSDPQWNVYNFAQNTSVILNITNGTPLPHPIHMHGHNFYVLNTGGFGEVWDGSVINPQNPMRRDVQIMPALGYIAIQFEADNPGIWPLHCHVAWHLSGGWYINMISMPEGIVAMPADQKASTCDAWSTWTGGHVVDQIDSGS